MIATMHAFTQLKSKRAKPYVERALTDGRWRVRVAGLETAAELKLKDVSSIIQERLRDEDSFVRYKAIEAYAAVNERMLRRS